MRRAALPAPAAPAVLAILAILAALALAGCTKRRSAPSGPPPEVTGLAAVPENADLVLGIDVARLAESPIVTRAIETLLSREPDLAGRWKTLRESCRVDIRQVSRIMIALGPPPKGGRFGTGPLVMIATGKISEPELVKCVREIVGKGGGSIVVKDQGGRSLYQVKEGARAMYVSFGRADTVILGNNDAYVVEAVGSGKKLLDNAEFAGWLARADLNAPVWIAGRVSDRLKTGLVRASSNTLKAGAKAFTGSLDLTSGVKAELVALMESAEDAKQLESLAKANLVPLTWAAQMKSLAKVMNKVTVGAQGDRVRISVPLTMDDVNRVLSALDGEDSSAQDSPPAGGSAAERPAR